MRWSVGVKLGLSAAVVALSVTVPLLAGRPDLAPAVFSSRIGGVPVSVWYAVGLYLLFPLLTWIFASHVAGEDEE